ncbi:hypothetical protein F7734_46110 [Scytonema sp. UIC 10036]|uniref:DUF5615 family PIN-like protein n=1 Tax=Scytonema sp. UIC 10036 TaxID=2304196 RepID=UPI0012DAD64A|nr:DUF5615 family PIN-like protein [Scytonema sp. UIC 10036]MUG99277.1 hypothetical protein [Scytonema sp. UIC 10036]
MPHFFYADENFPFPIVEFLRNFGHDVLTARDAGNANLKIPDENVLAFATTVERTVLTRNRRDFIKLHGLQPEHAGIIVCTSDSDFENQAIRIHEAVSRQEDLKGKLIRVNRLPMQ